MKERSGGRGRADQASALVTWPRLWHQEPVNLPVTVDMGVTYTARKSGCNMAATACSRLAPTVLLRTIYLCQSECWHSFSGTLSLISLLQKRLSLSPTFAVDSRLSGNLGLAWISATQAVGDRGVVKGDPPGAFPLAYTPVCAGYHFTSRPCSVWSLEAPSKCIPLPALCDRITHNPLRSVIPHPALQEHIVTIGKETRSTLSKCKGCFFVLYSPHVNQRSFISSAAKSEALSLRSGRLRSLSEDVRKSCYLVKIYYCCFKTRHEPKCFNISISRRTSYAGGPGVTFDGQGEVCNCL